MITRTLLTLYFFYNKKRLLTQNNPLDDQFLVDILADMRKGMKTVRRNIQELQKFSDLEEYYECLLKH